MRDPGAPRRACSKQTCNRDAVCTLTYVYSDSTAVIGALSARREPHAYDLCPVHADTLTAPRGWRVVRLESADGWDRDDLPDAVRAVPQDDGSAPSRTPGHGASLAASRPGAGDHEGRRFLRDVSYRPPADGAPGAEDTSREASEDPARRGFVAEDSVAHTVPAGGADGYSEPTRSIANANQHPVPTHTSVPLPAALRTPHWRRP
ncbi:DUF3499 family protein [Kocuria tytonis]|uniref:DUF3499 family protein n=1 Tax=Kocuria tytonis TaxID=2054280 RepID=A0A495A4J6_9MICC|nr:DUF3499 family protein [Kocuria tytonis]RKQ34149.1 DUF3499 family protein [Kocuria tytonis]